MANILELDSLKTMNVLSKNEILDGCETVILHEPIRYEIPISQISIIDYKTLNISGTDISIANETYNDLLNVIGLNSGTSTSFKKIIKDDRVYSLTNNLKNEYIKNVGDFNMVLYGDYDSKKIIKMKKRKKHDFATNEQCLKTVLDIINTYSLQVTEFISNIKGSFVIKTVPNFEELIISDSKFLYGSEKFYKGIIFVGDLTSYRIIPTTTRVKCLNQLSSTDLSDAIVFEDLSSESSKKIYNGIEHLKENEFLPKNFIRQLKRAYDTPASFNEYSKVINSVTRNSQIDINSLNLYFDYTENNKIINEFKEKEQLDLNPVISSKIAINKSMWELINCATYFASNSKQDEINNIQQLEIFNDCGKMLRGDKNGHFDLFFKSKSPFIKK